MTDIVQTSCPNCANRMRFKRPAQIVAAIRCPSCSKIFEVRSAELVEEPIVAVVVPEESPLEVEIIEDIPVEVADGTSASRRGQPAQLAPSTTPTVPKKRSATKLDQPIPKVATSSSNRLWVKVGAAAALAITLFGLGILGIKLIWRGAEDSDGLKLAQQYRSSLDELKTHLEEQKKKPDQESLKAHVDKFRGILFDCVKTPSHTDEQVKVIRTRINELNDLQSEVRRGCTLLPLSLTQSTKADQIPTLIDLINKQLSHGLRKLPEGQNRSIAYMSKTFDCFRTIDRRLAESFSDLSQPDLASIADSMDAIEELSVNYGEIAEDRTEMSFDQKQIFECGEAFRRWCLGQLTLAGHEKFCNALSNELNASKTRVDRALRATKLDKLAQNSAERINARIAAPSGLLFQGLANKANESSSSSVGVTKNSGDNSSLPNLANQQSSSPSSTATNQATASSDSTSASRSAQGISQPSNINPFTSTEQLDQDRPQSSPPISSFASQSGQTASSGASGLQQIDAGQLPVFPPSRYSSPQSLTIKIISKRSQAELKPIATRIAAKFKSVADVQSNGVAATISISNYPGKIFEAIEQLGIGKVEICDSQSRTIFVNDQQ